MRIKQMIARVVTSPGVSDAFEMLMRERATIFMLHRFRHVDTGIKGQDVGVVRNGLEYLRKRQYNLVTLKEVVTQAREGRLRPRTVAFTIDDGYWDHAAIAAPVFAQYDCPVTTFVTTGFVDGKLWFWWDKIEFVFEHTRRAQVAVLLGTTHLQYSTVGADGHRARGDFTERCKRIPDAEKHRAIAELAATAEVELPETPPPCYRPMTWDQARACERSGMTFGPHTVTHPILAQTPDAQSEREITDSWKRLSTEVEHAVPVFCYPNGGWEDFGDRELATLRKNELLGAVVGVQGYLDSTLIQRQSDARFKIRRFGFPNEISSIIQCTMGIERIKAAIRRQPL